MLLPAAHFVGGVPGAATPIAGYLEKKAVIGDQAQLHFPQAKQIVATISYKDLPHTTASHDCAACLRMAPTLTLLVGRRRRRLGGYRVKLESHGNVAAGEVQSRLPLSLFLSLSLLLLSGARPSAHVSGGMHRSRVERHLRRRGGGGDGKGNVELDGLLTRGRGHHGCLRRRGLPIRVVPCVEASVGARGRGGRRATRGGLTVATRLLQGRGHGQWGQR